MHLQFGRAGFDPWVGKIPWRRARQPTPVFLPGESPWTEEPGRLQSMGLQRVAHDWVTKHSTAVCRICGGVGTISVEMNYLEFQFDSYSNRKRLCPPPHMGPF